MRVKSLVIATCVIAVALGSLAADRDLESWEFSATATGFALRSAGGTYQSVRLIVNGPHEFQYSANLGPDDPITFDFGRVKGVDGSPIDYADGDYSWQLRIVVAVEELAEPRHVAGVGMVDSEPIISMASGRFSVLDGVIVPDARTLPLSDSGEELSLSVDLEREAAASKAASVTKVTNPFGNHFVGDLTVSSGACIGCADGAGAGNGFTISNGNSPAFDLIDLDDGAVWWIRTDATGDFALYDWNTSRYVATIQKNAPSNSLFIDDGGDVGIRTAPGANNDLHILGPDANAVITLAESTSGSFGEFYSGNSYMGFGHDDSTHPYTEPFRISKGAPNNAITADAEGDVGIGTWGTAYSLHVYRTNGTAQLRVEENSPTAAARSTFWLKNNGGNRFAMQNVDNGSIWQFNALASFNIDFNGHAGNEFQVQGDGDIVAGGRVFANGGSDVFPDFVFSDEYELMPLSDLSAFIKANRHLPKVPSAEEITAQGGVDMTGLQLTLLEKVEELTLHTIRQEERIENLLEEREGLAARLAELEAKLAAMTN